MKDDNRLPDSAEDQFPELPKEDKKKALQSIAHFNQIQNKSSIVN